MEDRFGGSFSVIYSALVEEGALGLVGYGILTAAQVIPGFLSFVASRYFVFTVSLACLCGCDSMRLIPDGACG